MDEYGNINARDYAKFALFNGITKDCYLIPPPDGTDIIACTDLRRLCTKRHPNCYRICKLGFKIRNRYFKTDFVRF